MSKICVAGAPYASHFSGVGLIVWRVRISDTMGERPIGAAKGKCDTPAMNPLLLILILLLLFGGGGFYFGGPVIGGSGIGLILLILLVVYLMGGLRSPRS